MTSYRYGYARVSTTDQNPALQIDALHAAGVDPGWVLVDVASGAPHDPAAAGEAAQPAATR